MSDQTPPITFFRQRFANEFVTEADRLAAEAMFDRALAAHDAEVRAGAWDSEYEAGAEDQAECEGHRYRDTPEMRELGFNHWRKTPHRKEGPE